MSIERMASARFLELAHLKRSELEALFLRGQTPDVDAVIDWEYRGMNIGMGPKLLGIQKFIKGFFRSAERQAMGYNVRAKQNGPRGPWAAKLDSGEPKRFGFYTVGPVDPEAKDNAYLHTLLLDYGKGGNPWFDITAGLRDYLVRIDRDSDDLLLGKAFIAPGPLRLQLGYFLIERFRPAKTPAARERMRS
jgi:hypothetical protein